jgi:hypothetical protein
MPDLSETLIVHNILKFMSEYYTKRGAAHLRCRLWRDDYGINSRNNRMALPIGSVESDVIVMPRGVSMKSKD